MIQHEFYTLLNGFLKDIIPADSGNCPSFNYQSANKLIKNTKQKFSFITVGKSLVGEDREVLSTYLIWFFNQLLYISVYGNDQK